VNHWRALIKPKEGASCTGPARTGTLGSLGFRLHPRFAAQRRASVTSLGKRWPHDELSPQLAEAEDELK